MKSVLTDYEYYCIFCGRPLTNNVEHHLIFGRGFRPLAEQDGLKLPICSKCHTSGSVKERIHDNVMAEKLSKMLGQMAFEKEQALKGMNREECRNAFRSRYGRSYL